MLLYHINFGYPIVDKDTVLIQSKTIVTPRDDEARKGIDNYNVFDDPVHDYKEQVFYHNMRPDKKGKVFACLFNKNLGTDGLGPYVKFDKSQIKNMIEWKQTGEGEYVVGLEPGTWYLEGRKKARESGQLDFIEPGEIKQFEIEVGVTDSIDKIGL